MNLDRSEKFCTRKWFHILHFYDSEKYKMIITGYQWTLYKTTEMLNQWLIFDALLINRHIKAQKWYANKRQFKIGDRDGKIWIECRRYHHFIFGITKMIRQNEL